MTQSNSQIDLVQRLDVYEYLLEVGLEKGNSIEASHNHAMGMAGLTDFGLIRARSMTGQPATFKPGIWPRTVESNQPMTIQFKTDAVYTLGSLKLLCTYIEDNTIWLKGDTYPVSDTTLLYKLERKSGKLYVFNTNVQAYDSVEGSLSEDNVMARYKPEDVTVIYDYLE